MTRRLSRVQRVFLGGRRYVSLAALALGLPLLPHTASAQAPTQPLAGPSEEENVSQVCKLALAKPLTPPSLAGPLSPSQLAGCDEAKLYFGLGNPPNNAAALQCGWYQRAHPNPTQGDIFQGPGVLSMLYANGRGVPQDLSLAIRFACENPWSSPAGLSYEVADLEHRRDNPAADAKPFSLCDDETSGLAEGNCAYITTATADADRNRKIAALVRALPPAAQAGFPALQKAQAEFADTRSREEVDLSGTGRGAFSLEDKARQNDQFLINLRSFTRPQPAPGDAATFAALDGKLNGTYQALQALPASKWQDGTVKPDGIQKTERAWLALVAAYLRYVPLAAPRANLVAVKIELWKLRLHQLSSLTPP